MNANILWTCIRIVVTCLLSQLAGLVWLFGQLLAHYGFTGFDDVGRTSACRYEKLLES